MGALHHDNAAFTPHLALQMVVKAIDLIELGRFAAFGLMDDGVRVAKKMVAGAIHLKQVNVVSGLRRPFWGKTSCDKVDTPIVVPERARIVQAGACQDKLWRRPRACRIDCLTHEDPLVRRSEVYPEPARLKADGARPYTASSPAHPARAEFGINRREVGHYGSYNLPVDEIGRLKDDYARRELHGG